MKTHTLRAQKNVFRAISQLLKVRFTVMVTYSFHLYSRSSHHFILSMHKGMSFRTNHMMRIVWVHVVVQLVQIKVEPRIKLNHSIYMYTELQNTLLGHLLGINLVPFFQRIEINFLAPQKTVGSYCSSFLVDKGFSIRCSIYLAIACCICCLFTSLLFRFSWTSIKNKTEFKGPKSFLCRLSLKFPKLKQLVLLQITIWLFCGPAKAVGNQAEQLQNLLYRAPEIRTGTAQCLGSCEMLTPPEVNCDFLSNAQGICRRALTCTCSLINTLIQLCQLQILLVYNRTSWTGHEQNGECVCGRLLDCSSHFVQV